MRPLMLFMLLSISYAVQAQVDELNPVKWSFEVEKVGVDEYKLIYKADIEDKWAIYSQFIEDGGPIATSFTIEEDGGVELVGKVIEPENSEKVYDELFEMEVIKLKGNPVFYQVVKTKEKSPIVKGYLTFMSCDDSRCLPPTDVAFEFVVQ